MGHSLYLDYLTVSKVSFFRLGLVSLVAFLNISIASAQTEGYRKIGGGSGSRDAEKDNQAKIYKYTDKDGRIRFSSTPVENGLAVDLPKLEKENFDNTLSNIKTSIQTSCAKHGGNDCSKGEDVDSSIICVDGFRDSAAKFIDICSNGSVSLNTVIRFEQLEDEVSSKIIVTARNNSEIFIKGMAGELIIKSEIYPQYLPPESHNFVGPATIEPYSIAEYMVEIKHRKITEEIVRAKFSCLNCTIKEK